MRLTFQKKGNINKQTKIFTKTKKSLLKTQKKNKKNKKKKTQISFLYHHFLSYQTQTKNPKKR